MIKKCTVFGQIIFMICCMLLAVVIFGTVMIIVYSENTESRLYDSMMDNLQYYSGTVENEAEKLEQVISSLVYDNTFQENVWQLSEEDVLQAMKARNQINERFQNIMQQMQYINSVRIINNEGKILFSEGNGSTTEYAEELLKTEGFMSFCRNSETNEFVAVCKMLSTNRYTWGIMGSIVFHLNERAFFGTLASEDDRVSRYIVLDKNYKPIYNSEIIEDYGIELKDIEKMSVVKHNNRKFLICSDKEDNDNFSFYSVLDYNAVTHDIVILMLAMVGLLIILIMMLIGMGLYFGKVITFPLKNLNVQLERIEKGDFNVDYMYPKEKTKNELYIFQYEFFSVIEKMNQLIKDNYISQYQFKEASLKLLQMQIHPHFLYNTIDIMYWVAIEHDDGEIAEVAKRLGEVFRYSTDVKTDVVDIAKEVEFIKSYIKIQEIRYEGRFSIDISVAEECLEVMIPKFSIQPLVENAIKYTVEVTSKFSEIKINIYKDGDAVVISVSDNGGGIDEDMLDRILSGELKKGVALTNINERIHYLFGDDFGVFANRIDDISTVGFKVPFSWSEKGVGI